MISLGFLAAASLLCWPGVAETQPGRGIAVGEVSAGRSGAGPAAVSALRRALEGAARTVTRQRRPWRPVVLTGAVSRFERARRGSRLVVECEVSLVVMEATGGQMRAVLTGRASSEGGLPVSSRDLVGIEEGIVATAAESALSNLPSILATI